MSATTTYPYIFDSISRIGNDNVAIDQRNIQNMTNANYRLENYYPNCPMSTAIDFATKQPQVFYNGSHEGGIKGCEIDANNELKYTHITKPACKLTLSSRPFITVPYLGKGMGDSDTEFMLRAGENALNKKTVNLLMENNFTNYKNYPLIDPIKNIINNSAYKIEEDAMKGWNRSGISARNYARDQAKK